MLVLCRGTWNMAGCGILFSIGCGCFLGCHYKYHEEQTTALIESHWRWSVCLNRNNKILGASYRLSART